MKKFGLMVLVSVVLLSLGMASCTSFLRGSWALGTKELDISTLDPSQSIPVVLISLPVEGTSSEQLDPAEADKTLDLVCGSALKNWEAIAKRFKVETGLTLNGDEFMQAMKSGDSSKILTKNSKALSGKPWLYYVWDNSMLAESPVANIELRYSGNEILPYYIAVFAFDMNETTGLGENPRRHILYW